MIVEWVIRALGIIAVLSALVAITRRNPIYSAVFLGLNFLCLGGIFTFYVSPFVGAVQIIVYAGAILVLFVLAIMILNLRDEDLGPSRRTVVKFFAVIAAIGVVWLIITITAGFVPPGREAGTISAAQVGRALLEAHVVAFEVISVLLITAVVGAVVLAKKRMEV